MCREKVCAVADRRKTQLGLGRSPRRLQIPHGVLPRGRNFKKWKKEYPHPSPPPEQKKNNTQIIKTKTKTPLPSIGRCRALGPPAAAVSPTPIICGKTCFKEAALFVGRILSKIACKITRFLKQIPLMASPGLGTYPDRRVSNFCFLWWS